MRFSSRLLEGVHGFSFGVADGVEVDIGCCRVLVSEDSLDRSFGHVSSRSKEPTFSLLSRACAGRQAGGLKPVSCLQRGHGQIGVTVDHARFTSIAGLFRFDIPAAGVLELAQLAVQDDLASGGN